ncbi:MAG: hypothetical protein LAT76_00215 [Schleiferiaceae bacterium]|nr:hypothetical protein [Schleiferiaceae bacterium]
MKNITTGHWIFAAIFAIAFVGFLFWSYTKDKPMHKIHYRGNFVVTLVLIVIFFLLFIFKRVL